jgi:hypothetical protein
LFCGARGLLSAARLERCVWKKKRLGVDVVAPLPIRGVGTQTSALTLPYIPHLRQPSRLLSPNACAKYRGKPGFAVRLGDRAASQGAGGKGAGRKEVVEYKKQWGQFANGRCGVPSLDPKIDFSATSRVKTPHPPRTPQRQKCRGTLACFSTSSQEFLQTFRFSGFVHSQVLSLTGTPEQVFPNLLQ